MKLNCSVCYIACARLPDGTEVVIRQLYGKHCGARSRSPNYSVHVHVYDIVELTLSYGRSIWQQVLLSVSLTGMVPLQSS